MSDFEALSKPGVHEKALRDHFGPNAVFTGTTPVFDHPLYCLAFFNRSGSNLLAEHLRATPYFSGFQEQLIHSAVINQSTAHNLSSFPDYIRHVSAKGAGVHGFKASVDQLMMLERFNIPRMYAGGMRLIHIIREDVVGQAVSYAIASQTLQWTSRQKAVRSESEVHYDPALIAGLMEGALRSRNGIQLFAKVFDIPMIEVSYEQVVKRPKSALRRVGRFHGLPTGDWKIIKPRIDRQAGEINDQFRSAFLDYMRQKLG